MPPLSAPASRKRRASSPLGPDKRRRPNLANGFSSLSLHPAAQPTPPPLDDTDDDGLGPSNYPRSNDLKVEVLPESSSTQESYAPTPHHRHARPHHWSHPSYGRPPPSSSSNSPPSSSDETYDSEATTTRFSRPRRYAGAAQQADEIVQPDAIDPVAGYELGVEDVTGVPPPLRGRRPREDDSAEGPMEKRRRRDDMDIDMDADPVPPSGEPDSIKDRMRTRKTVWHEPEKDRIVITSLSDSDSRSSRSPSPEVPEVELAQGRLSQPGEHGFTLSPSLLTHLMRARRDYDFQVPLSELLRNNERGLTLYRPLGIPPGKWKDDIVRTWEEAQADADAGRFEEIDEDEDFTQSSNPCERQSAEGMDVEPEVVQPWANPWTEQEEATSVDNVDEDMAMDVED
ncbi:hypothetical protein L202_07945 [Cryptococcus amylolentus CBS 6039]|uniref:Uncharacterized protein n=1 Tax=Cryptococcus amylolentus CBS 6039 TaxID=1295533 RepID=A0A1E3HAR6_9TREE|nr:hypothetical protein L202_07945 [Cryptococcus amylolentus CBS 6039]ODN73420.1 hypothetical protein L202_07945 [Cryptococcus amylolentus CBS 6039]